ncbi:MAG: redoxin domain-containing protein [Bacteroidetes bacterium]|nr:redoxin domain-containing protein [Bacteroidota bacterium]
MKKLLFIALSVCLFFPSFAQKKSSATVRSKKAKVVKKQSEKTVASLALGAEIPAQDIMLQNVNGRGMNLQEARREKGLLVLFICNSCPCVQKAMPLLQHAMKMTQEMNIGMVLVNSNASQRNGDESPQAMQEYVMQHQLLLPYLVDEGNQIVSAFGATHTPEMFLFNAEGKLVYKGALEDSPLAPERSTRKYILEALQAMVGGQSITPAATKSIGCVIQ